MKKHVVMAIAIAFVISMIMVASASAQTTSPSKTARNYNDGSSTATTAAPRHNASRRRHRRSVRKYVRRHSRIRRAHKPAAPAIMLETNDAKFVVDTTDNLKVADNKYVFEIAPGGFDFVVKVLNKADNTATDVKLINDYSPEKFHSDVVQNVSVDTTAPSSISGTALFPGTIEIPFTSEAFPTLRGVLVVKVTKVLANDVKSDVPATNEMSAANTEGEINFVAHDASGNDIGPARLEVTSDNDNVKVDFREFATDRMKLHVTATPGKEDVTATLTITAKDKTDDCGVLTITIVVKGTDNTASNSADSTDGNNDDSTDSSSKAPAKSSPSPKASPSATSSPVASPKAAAKDPLKQ